MSEQANSREQELEDALAEALALIESYQADIRQAELHATGFCQGAVYREGPVRLHRILGRRRFAVLPDGTTQWCRPGERPESEHFLRSVGLAEGGSEE